MLEVEVYRCERLYARAIGVLDASQDNGRRGFRGLGVGAWHGRILMVIAGDRFDRSQRIPGLLAIAIRVSRRSEAPFRCPYFPVCRAYAIGMPEDPHFLRCNNLL